jgi:ABC-type transport system involved in multi-copper enzyme maturation permease subunit
LRSPRPWRTLVAKEWRELVVSRAWWVLLLAMGPLVGVTFISAVRAYAELSGLNGNPVAGVGEAFSPLVGIWAPTFSASELAAAFLLPFVAIRVVSADRQSGALKLELQHPLSSFARIGAKAIVLMAGWIVASLPPVIAIVLWRAYGGTIYGPELLTVAAGHILNAALTIGLAAAAAAITEHPSTAAIVTLSVTVGTWILNFIAAVQGGIWERAAGYTPTAMVAEFQHGLIRLDVVLVATTIFITGLALAAIWTRLGVAVNRRVSESMTAGAFAAAVIFAAAFAGVSWDTSEARANSFPKPDEIALKQIRSPLRIEAHLAAEDPRRVDLERKAISKLRRTMRRVDVTYVAATTTGLFEQTASQYGEIWYDLDGRRAMSRVTTAEGVLETIFSLAGIQPPVESDNDIFRGHPLAVPPKGAAAVFYGIWPALVAAAAFIFFRS